MIRLFANAHYDFIRWRRWAYGLTGVIIIPGFALFLVHGLNYSIEFTGGTLIQVHTTTPVGTGKLRASLYAAVIRDSEIQQFGDPTEYVIRARIGTEAEAAASSTEATAQAVDSALARGLGRDQYKFVRHEAVGPKVGRELQGKAFLAIFFSFIVTLVYLAFRFEWRFGLAAVLATFHDILTTIAFIRYLNLEVSLVVVGAVLTMVGYSLNDTIIIFTGTFSSVYIAAPILLYIEKRWPGEDARGARTFRPTGAVAVSAPEPPPPPATGGPGARSKAAV